MASNKSEVYKCSICGNMVEVVHSGAGTLVCCNQPMQLNRENTTDAAQEKHVPVMEKAAGGIDVTVGSVAHPMADDHFIEWIEVTAGGKSCREFLKPGQKPKASFALGGAVDGVRAYCNLHGLWKAT